MHTIQSLRFQKLQRLHFLLVQLFEVVDAVDVLHSDELQSHTPGVLSVSHTSSQLEHAGHRSKRGIINTAALAKTSSFNEANA